MMETFETFIKERKYLHNVSERTFQWYEESFAWLGKYPLTAEGIKEFVIGMRQAGLKPVSSIPVSGSQMRSSTGAMELGRSAHHNAPISTFPG
jgi:hypothetical protein